MVSMDEAPPKAQDLQAELDASRRQVEDLLTTLKYLQAEFENYRKRAARDSEALVKFAHEGVLLRLLPILDEFDAAVTAAEGPAGEGIRMVRSNLVKALEEVGLQAIPDVGVPFDPYVHECVEQVADSESKDGIVRQVVRRGYRLHDRILRPAQVVVVNNGGESNG
ncbi:MAG: nucleotide exchange factor GrpE [Methanobacteriota archaeon]